MTNLFVAPPVSDWKDYGMVTPTGLQQVGENNSLAVSNGPQKPVSCTPAPSELSNLSRRDSDTHRQAET
jgi:hypothetical protein